MFRSPDYSGFLVMGCIMFGVLLTGFFALFGWCRRGVCRDHVMREDFASQLLEQEEVERKRVSLAIHDGLGHQLLGLKNVAAKARDHPAADAALREQLETISTLASQSLEQARGIAYRLRPFELDQLGLKAALEALVADLFKNSDLRVFQDLEELPKGFAPVQELHLFRLVQEGLVNVLHHAHASTVLLEIKKDRGQFRVQLEDDGMGFSVAEVRQRRNDGLGLARMEVHAKALGGELEISSAAGRETRLRLRFPQKQTEPE